MNDLLRKIILPYWMREPDHYEFAVTIQPSKVFRDPQGNLHPEPITERMMITISFNSEAVKKYPSKSSLARLVEDMAARFQIDFVEACK